MSDKTKNDYKKDYELYYNLNAVASFSDCTGLIPSLPLSDAESESYNELLRIPLQSTIDKNE